jgi:glycosyltransferase involved in cell wall biosynthesis
MTYRYEKAVSGLTPVGRDVDSAAVLHPALVHDYLLVMRGAERTFAAIASCWPEAPIFTLLCDRELVGAEFAGHAVTPSYLQRLGPSQRGFRRLMPLFAHAAERLALADYDVVLSSSSAFAHGVRTKPGAIHICYCHSPFRYAWHELDATVRRMPAPLRPPTRTLLRRARRWDASAAGRVSHYIANSKLTQRRIHDYYGRASTVIHPPVDVSRFHRAPAEDFFLVVCEVVWHKRVAIALEAARLADRPLVVVGGGPDLKRLAARYERRGVTFAGRVSDAALADLYARARALVVPNVEEFGIAAVEAQAAGRPVIAAAGGGVIETTVPGETSVLVPAGDAQALAEAMRDGEFDRFSSDRIRAHAAGFSIEAFKRRLLAEVERVSQSSAAR